MGPWRAAWTGALRPFLAALVGTAIGVNAATAQPPTELPPAVPAVPAEPLTTVPQVVMPPVVVTAPPTDAGAPCASPACDPCAFDWLKVPPVTRLPRMGVFHTPPTGPGYYSLLDLLTDTHQAQAPRAPYGLYSINPVSFFDYDFRYFENANCKDTDCADALKRIRANDVWLFSTGGEFRSRYANETNSRGSGIDNNYYLLRGRVYGDLWYKDEFRVFVEGTYSQTFNQNLPQQARDATGTDLLNAFIEAKVGCLFDSPVYIRGGRQELLYGSQRLISTLDWANTRRTFQGVKAYWHSDNLDVDAFWMQPVAVNRDDFDPVETNRNFFGSWATWRPRPGTTLDLYYLGLLTARAPGEGDTQTLGGRYAGDIDGRFLYDAEGAVQFGERDGRRVFAQMASGGLGYRFKDMDWNPQAWVCYDYASGDKDPLSTTNRTFNQLFPFGHYYFGYLDLVGRQNIRDLNFQFTYNPQPWITSITQFHVFKLDARRDALYDANGNAIRRDPTGRAGDDVGQEIDLATNIHLTPHQDVLVGYSKLYAGDFWKRTGPSANPELYYVQYSLRW